jgi:uncharacterized protein (TIGR03089 family)
MHNSGLFPPYPLGVTVANDSAVGPGATIPALWRAAHALGPGRPFLTYYDDHTGERVELSYTTFDNWVSKTANLIQDELALTPGDEIALLLPTHWQTPIWLVACWIAGVTASVAEAASPEAAAVVARAAAVVTGPSEESVDVARGCKGERIALALRPLGTPFAAGRLPEGFTDYATVVPGCADSFTPYEPVRGDNVALIADGRTWTHAELVGDAVAAAGRWGLVSASRVLAGCGYATYPEVRAALTSELVVGATLVLCRNVDPSRLPGRIAAEKVTARVMSVPGDGATDGGSLGVLPTEQ